MVKVHKFLAFSPKFGRFLKRRFFIFCMLLWQFPKTLHFKKYIIFTSYVYLAGEHIHGISSASFLFSPLFSLLFFLSFLSLPPYILFCEREFHCVAQADLKLNPLASVSQVLG
jgi:hypothetical protein